MPRSRRPPSRRRRRSWTGPERENAPMLAALTQEGSVLWATLPVQVPYAEVRRAMDAGETGAVYCRADGRYWLLMATPLQGQARPLWLAQAWDVSHLFTEREPPGAPAAASQPRRRWRRPGAAAAAVSVWLTRPLRALDEAARALAAGDGHARAQVASGDELESLGESFNRMADAIGGADGGAARRERAPKALCGGLFARAENADDHAAGLCVDAAARPACAASAADGRRASVPRGGPAGGAERPAAAFDGAGGRRLRAGGDVAAGSFTRRRRQSAGSSGAAVPRLPAGRPRPGKRPAFDRPCAQPCAECGGRGPVRRQGVRGAARRTARRGRCGWRTRAAASPPRRWRT